MAQLIFLCMFQPCVFTTVSVVVVLFVDEIILPSPFGLVESKNEFTKNTIGQFVGSPTLGGLDYPSTKNPAQGFAPMQSNAISTPWLSKLGYGYKSSDQERRGQR